MAYLLLIMMMSDTGMGMFERFDAAGHVDCARSLSGGVDIIQNGLLETHSGEREPGSSVIKTSESANGRGEILGIATRRQKYIYPEIITGYLLYNPLLRCESNGDLPSSLILRASAEELNEYGGKEKKYCCRRFSQRQQHMQASGADTPTANIGTRYRHSA